MKNKTKPSDPVEIVRRLDIYYGLIKRQLLRHQSATTGLFPTVSTEKKEGSVRESIYCAAAVWSLYQAYRRIDDDRGKSYEIGQSAVKCMRGILQCWINQAAKIELFKRNQCNTHALHCKFHLVTGHEIYSVNYPHLQIDIISLYLLYLVQMISSGLQIIYTQDEVAFVQNLVYYVERAYRTPDFGIWERGSKYNNGVPEIHASSIGLAKSALEAINGYNLFGEQGASWSVIYVDIDAHNRNRSIFYSMLPRESSSKEVDAGLLPIISFPAFATHNQNYIDKTMRNIITKLKGQYGFKRFPRDGFKTVLEDEQRQFYFEGEIKEFEKIECEWPLFFIFMIIDGVFKNSLNQIEEYQKLLKSRMTTDHYGDPVIPMYYYVHLKDIEKERLHPGQSHRFPSSFGRPKGGLFLWAQAMFIIAQLLTENLLHINELDPIRRYQSPHDRPFKVGRYSAFQGPASDLIVQIVLIAESSRLQAMMATYGIQTQTPHQVEPVQIWSSSELVRIYENLGVSSKLNLEGRPSRPIGALGTSKIYRICGMTVLCYPLVFEVSEFYLYRDMALLINDIKTEMQFVSHNWRLSGRPTVCLLIREEHMRDPYFKEMLDLMALLKRGYCNGTKVRIGRLQNLISSSCVEHLDFMNEFDLTDLNIKEFKQLEHNHVGYQSLTDIPMINANSEPITQTVQNYSDKSLVELIEDFRNSTELKARCQILDILLHLQGQNYEINGSTVGEHIENLYYLSGSRHCWDIVRHCSSLLKHTVDSISPFITTVLVNGKQLTVGIIGHEEIVLDKPITPKEIHSIMYNRVQPHNVIHAVLQQEVVLYCGRLIATEPQVFKGILKIRVGWVLQAISLYLSKNVKNKKKPSKPLECLSPSQVRQLVYKVLTVKEWAAQEKLTILEKRQLEGCLCRVPPRFYDRIWDILSRTPNGLCIGDRILHQQPILSNMVRSEFGFALLVEEILNNIRQPEYRQIIVELLSIVSTILSRNPELNFENQLNLDHLVNEALQIFIKENPSISEEDFKSFFSAPLNVTTSYLARAVVNNVLHHSTVLSIIPINQEHEDHCKIS